LVLDELPTSAWDRLRRFDAVEQAVSHLLRDVRAHGYLAELSPLLWTLTQLATFSYLHLDLATDAVLLYDREALLERRLDQVRRRMLGLGTRRVPYRGGYYWDLKPDM
jgi:hypothetical protein